MARPWYRRRWVILSSVGIVACIALFWLNLIWREYSGKQQLVAAMAVASADLLSWQEVANPFQHNQEKFIAFQELQRLLKESDQLNAKDLAQWRKQYLIAAELPMLLSLARWMRCSQDQYLQQLHQDEKTRASYWPNGWFVHVHAPHSGIDWLDQKLQLIWKKYLFFPSDRDWPGARAAILELHNELVEIAKLPEREWIPATMQKSNPEAECLFMQNWVEGYGCAGFWTTMREGPIKSQLEYRSLLRCAAAACAAEEFRLENGRWPVGWSELVPSFLPEIPLDGFTQKPLIWKTLSDGLVIYSVGRDGRDNGGNVLGSEEEPAKDVGIRLWHPNQRKKETVVRNENQGSVPKNQDVPYQSWCTGKLVMQVCQ